MLPVDFYPKLSLQRIIYVRFYYGRIFPPLRDDLRDLNGDVWDGKNGTVLPLAGKRLTNEDQAAPGRSMAKRRGLIFP